MPPAADKTTYDADRDALAHPGLRLAGLAISGRTDPPDVLEFIASPVERRIAANSVRLAHRAWVVLDTDALG